MIEKVCKLVGNAFEFVYAQREYNDELFRENF